MAKNVKKIAEQLGATVVGELPDVGGGAFGAAHLGKIVAALQERLEPSQGRRPGRPTDARWVHHPKVPMSEETLKKLARLAERASSEARRVSPMQVAAQLLEEAVAACRDEAGWRERQQPRLLLQFVPSTPPHERKGVIRTCRRWPS